MRSTKGNIKRGFQLKSIWITPSQPGSTIKSRRNFRMEWESGLKCTWIDSSPIWSTSSLEPSPGQCTAKDCYRDVLLQSSCPLSISDPANSQHVNWFEHRHPRHHHLKVHHSENHSSTEQRRARHCKGKWNNHTLQSELEESTSTN